MNQELQRAASPCRSGFIFFDSSNTLEIMMLKKAIMLSSLCWAYNFPLK
ncbi:MAG: hypothetical protein QGE97_06495 [SAR324 cluster bacterium]|uniref:Uncharacterized protein n=1 Tax=marine metagenome TaxID=408172 RepID=A0A382MWS6_9ZZZZ|nr:hypothetical protein [SAR324 cluster bacterium]